MLPIVLMEGVVAGISMFIISLMLSYAVTAIVCMTFMFVCPSSMFLCVLMCVVYL